MKCVLGSDCSGRSPAGAGSPQRLLRSPPASEWKVVHPAAEAAIWNVPPVSGRFVGRERLVGDLAERLVGGEAAALT